MRSIFILFVSLIVFSFGCALDNGKNSNPNGLGDNPINGIPENLGELLSQDKSGLVVYSTSGNIVEDHPITGMEKSSTFTILSSDGGWPYLKTDISINAGDVKKTAVLKFDNGDILTRKITQVSDYEDGRKVKVLHVFETWPGVPYDTGRQAGQTGTIEVYQDFSDSVPCPEDMGINMPIRIARPMLNVGWPFSDGSPRLLAFADEFYYNWHIGAVGRVKFFSGHEECRVVTDYIGRLFGGETYRLSGDNLYEGVPKFALGEITFYERCVDTDEDDDISVKGVGTFFNTDTMQWESKSDTCGIFGMLQQQNCGMKTSDYSGTLYVRKYDCSKVGKVCHDGTCEDSDQCSINSDCEESNICYRSPSCSDSDPDACKSCMTSVPQRSCLVDDGSAPYYIPDGYVLNGRKCCKGTLSDDDKCKKTVQSNNWNELTSSYLSSMCGYGYIPTEVTYHLKTNVYEFWYPSCGKWTSTPDYNSDSFCTTHFAETTNKTYPIDLNDLGQDMGYIKLSDKNNKQLIYYPQSNSWFVMMNNNEWDKSPFAHPHQDYQSIPSEVSGDIEYHWKEHPFIQSNITDSLLNYETPELTGDKFSLEYSAYTARQKYWSYPKVEFMTIKCEEN
ncbi:hypothetical protein ACFL20_07115 [Spirochaetota bacterium]